MTLRSLISTILLFVFALSLTIIIEWGLSFIFLKQKSDRKVVILAQILTNPALNLLLFLNNVFFKFNSYILLGILEISVTIIEAIVYKKYLSKETKTSPLLLSLLLNFASLSVGLLIGIVAKI